MKISTIIIAAALTLTVNTLFAGNDGGSANPNTVLNPAFLVSLAPSTPAVATFEEVTAAFEFFPPAPVTPSEASFEDASEDIAITIFEPVTPIEADFNDATSQDINISSLAPLTPSSADFE